MLERESDQALANDSTVKTDIGRTILSTFVLVSAGWLWQQPADAAPSEGRYANGEFTGSSADTAWGPVQVKVVVRDGTVAQVQPLVFPDHRRRSIEINNWALPILQHEVIQVQTANIDMVTQATVTSWGYQQSLASALAQAKK